MLDAVISWLESNTRGIVAGVQAHLDESHSRTRMKSGSNTFEIVEMALGDGTCGDGAGRTSTGPH